MTGWRPQQVLEFFFSPESLWWWWWWWWGGGLVISTALDMAVHWCRLVFLVGELRYWVLVTSHSFELGLARVGFFF